MNNLTISVFENQTFLDILNELKLLKNYKIKFYDNINLFNNNNKKDELIIFFPKDSNLNFFKKIIKSNYPAIAIGTSSSLSKIKFSNSADKIITPFQIYDLEKKIISTIAKHKFGLSSLINLGAYEINKNERKIKKGNLELVLTEKEINFLILFSENNKPLTRNFILENLWHYSLESETHTIETHIHRLRKKISKKFNDNNFIKNTGKGYYI